MKRETDNDKYPKVDKGIYKYIKCHQWTTSSTQSHNKCASIMLEYASVYLWLSQENEHISS